MSIFTTTAVYMDIYKQTDILTKHLTSLNGTPKRKLLRTLDETLSKHLTVRYFDKVLSRRHYRFPFGVPFQVFRCVGRVPIGVYQASLIVFIWMSHFRSYLL